MKGFKYLKSLPCILLLLISCSENNTGIVRELVAEIKDKHAPDERVAIFNIEVISDNDIILQGESNLPEAVDALHSSLSNEGIDYTDSITILPSKDLKGKIYGVVTLSVANMRSKANHSSELVTQAALGTPLTVLKMKRGWYLVQTPDKYISWVDGGGVAVMDKKMIEKWQDLDKLIYTNPFGFSYESPNSGSQTVTDLVSGCLVGMLGQENNFYKVQYPNGDTAYVSAMESQPYKEWMNSLNPTADNLVKTSKKLMGLPYLWGGTSFKGVDCSGFTKTIYFLNGMIIPRDASQQVQVGQMVDSARVFENLLPGDLLFFGRKSSETDKERVWHVGMWIGKNEFIHSSGKVHISSMDSTASNFDRFNYDHYLRAKRLIHQKDDKILSLKNNMLF